MSFTGLNSIKGSLNVVTGAGSGLGRATLRRLIKQGCGPILGIDRKFEEDYEEKLDLSAEEKSKLHLKTHDTFDEVHSEASLSEFASKFGTIDNLINVAGVALSFLLVSKKLSLYDLSHINNLIRFNTVGTFNMIRLASKHMINYSLENPSMSRTRCIINASCISTHTPSLGQTGYAGSKASLDSMTLCIARELSPFSIRCNTIDVGYFDTKLLRSSDEKVRYHLEQSVALCPRRLGDPDEFAHLVQSIIENQMLNGSCIKLDAGARDFL